jgi:hypothetical protein
MMEEEMISETLVMFYEYIRRNISDESSSRKKKALKYEIKTLNAQDTPRKIELSYTVSTLNRCISASSPKRKNQGCGK